MKEGAEKIVSVLSTFTGKNGEPGNTHESYMLRAMWVMMLSEFEASFKELVERYLDQVKTLDISDVHVCLLIRNFRGEKKDELTPGRIVSYYKKKASDIQYGNFTGDKKAKYKPDAVQRLLNNLGIFPTDDQITSIALLGGLASTRDAIAHGDTNISITSAELVQNVQLVSELVETLKGILVI